MKNHTASVGLDFFLYFVLRQNGVARLAIEDNNNCKKTHSIVSVVFGLQ